MKKRLINNIENLQSHISFLAIAERNNIHLDTIFCYYNDVISCLEGKSKLKIENLLNVIHDNVFKLDYKNNIYHAEIKHDILVTNADIRSCLNIF